MSLAQPVSQSGEGSHPRGARSPAPLVPTLVLAVALACGVFLVVMSATLVAHPQHNHPGPFAHSINQQNQTAKTVLYLFTFLVLLPLSLLGAQRMVDRIWRGPNADALEALVAITVAALGLMLMLVRVSHRLPWGDGLRPLLAGSALWVIGVLLLLIRAGGTDSPALRSLRRFRLPGWRAAAILVFASLLCVSKTTRFEPLAVVVAVLVLGAVFAGLRRARIPHVDRRLARALEVILLIAVALAIPDVVFIKPTGGLPSIYGGPGIVQFQHDYLLGSVNQLLGGGALLVNVPISQYGVGALDFIAGWFHLAPIGYGTFAALDALLTVLFYLAGYAILRMAGVGRLLAGAACVLAVLALVLGLLYPVGQLPEQGPLRFGLPMVVILGAVLRQRWPARAGIGTALILVALAVSAVWALEAFAYTLFTWFVVVAVEAALRTGPRRLRWLGLRLLTGAAAVLAGHLVFALLTLAGSGHLPDWSHYLAYAHAFLIHGTAAAISYGYQDWSPGLAVGAGTLASAAALWSVVRRAPAFARSEPVTMTALAGLTAFSVALLSYANNRSSTYLLPYVSLPLLLGAVLWLSLILRAPEVATAVKRGALTFGTAVAVLLIASAWPHIGSRFDDSALAHAYPGGGLTQAIHRLWHLPPIDPRAPEGERLLARFMPGRKAVILLPTVPDLGTEILIRSRKSNLMFIGDPKADSNVPSVWVPKLTAQVAALRSTQRVLLDSTALRMLPTLRRLSLPDVIAVSQRMVLTGPLAGGWSEIEWLLAAIDRRFQIVPIFRDPDGLIVAQLRLR